MTNQERVQIAAERLQQALQERNAEHAAQLGTEQRQISDEFTDRMTAIIQKQLERNENED